MIADVPDDERWDWYQFSSERDPMPIEDWLAKMKDEYPDHFLAIKDQLAQMQVTPFSEWEDERLFDPLEGEGGISEIRIDPPFYVNQRAFFYRIYGFADEDRASYVFLHGTNKRRKNDEHGKSVAKKRLAELYSGEAKAREISLE